MDDGVRIKLSPRDFLYHGQWDSTSSPGSKPPMSSWVFALNSFVLPIQEVERQSCS